MKNWLKLNNIFFIPDPEVQKLFDSALIYNLLHLQCCSCKHQILGIKNIFLEIIYHCLESLLHCSTCTVEYSSLPNEQLSPPISQSLANSLDSLFYQKIVFLKDLIASNCIVVPQLLIFIYLTMVKFFQISPRHPCRSISTTSVNVKQIITARLHPNITSEIM